MLIKNLKKHPIKPTGNLIAFQFIPRKSSSSGIFIPDSHYDMGLRAGKMLLGRVLAIGPKVIHLKKDDFFVFHEYGLKNFEGTPSEEIVYFIEEDGIRAKIEDLKNPKTFSVRGHEMTEKEEWEMMKKDKESFPQQ